MWTITGKTLVRKLCVQIKEGLFLGAVVVGIFYIGWIATVIGGVGPTCSMLACRLLPTPLSAGLADYFLIANPTRITVRKIRGGGNDMWRGFQL